MTRRAAHLHNECIDTFEIAGRRMPDDQNSSLYANSYRPMQSKEEVKLAMWLHALSVGDELPNLPLFLRGNDCIEAPPEETYLETCGDQRIDV